MLVSSSNITNDLSLQAFNEAWQPLCERYFIPQVVFLVEGRTKAKLSVLIGAHSIDMAACAEHHSVRHAATHLLHHSVEAANLGKHHLVRFLISILICVWLHTGAFRMTSSSSISSIRGL